MCAIAGIFNLEGKFSLAELKGSLLSMAQKMAHRGPDREGVWVDPDGVCGFSHRRLSIIDVSDAGTQPMSSTDGQTWITFNGEIYNYLDLRQELESREHVFRTKTDTEVLLLALRELGAGVLERLDGMYAFGYYDAKMRQLVLARDPFGEKPLYYTWIRGALCFASELHAFHSLEGFDPTIEESALAEFLCFQYVDSPRTLYRSVHKLPPAHHLTLSLERKQPLIRRYFEFSPGRGKGTGRSLDLLADELEEILVRNLRRRLISDVPLGAFLSGGVDSSTVVALVTKVLGRSLKTFSIGFDQAPDSEHVDARETALHCQTEHHEKLLSPDVLSLMQTLGKVLDEPNADSSCLPTYLLSQFTREKVTVALSGDGGDEMFLGYGRYADTLDDEILMKQAKGKKDSWTPGSAYYSSRILVWQDSDLEALFGYLPSSLRDHLDSLRCDLNEANPPLYHRLRKTDVDHYLPGAVLPKVDRMSMQHALEVRTPFLSIDLARFAERLDLAALRTEGQSKRILKRVTSRYLPEAWLNRRKQGFGLPTAIWGRDALMKAAEGLLMDQETQLARWIEPRRLQYYLKWQQTHRHFQTYQMWALLILELYLRNHPYRVGRFELRHDDTIVLNYLKEKDQPVTIFCDSPEPQWVEALSNKKNLIVSSRRWTQKSENGHLQLDWTQFSIPADAQQKLQQKITPTISVICNHDRVPQGLAETMRAMPPQEVLCFQGGTWFRQSSHRLGQEKEEDVRFQRLLKKLCLTGMDLRKRPESAPSSAKPFQLDLGFCYKIKVNPSGSSPSVSSSSLDLLLFEDGEPLPYAGSLRSDIIRLGGGRYCYEDGYLYLSSLDHTDPNTNGREYRACMGTGLRPVLDRLKLLNPPYCFPPDSPLFSWQRLQSWNGPQEEIFVANLQKAIEIENERREEIELPLHEARKICLVVGHLGSGGAERQICNLGLELSKHGYEVDLFVTELIHGGASHYAYLLEEGRVRLIHGRVPNRNFDFAQGCLDLPPHRRQILSQVPDFLKDKIWSLYTHLSACKPDVIHSFLDYPNMISGIAGWIAGIPKIFLSIRNVNPSNFDFHHPCFHPFYSALVRSQQIQMLGNAQAGIKDYARWLDISSELFRITRNGLMTDHLTPTTQEEKQRFRRELGISKETPLLCGIFRLAHEKRPWVFLQVVEQLIKQFKTLKVIIAGEGPLETEMQAFIQLRGMAQNVQLLGRRKDVDRIISSSDLMLLTSAYEGTPNVLLESQYLGTPVVCTDVGGCGEIMVHGETGFLCSKDSIQDLQQRCAELIQNRELRSRMSHAGKKWVRENFLFEKIVDQTLELYRTPSPHPTHRHSRQSCKPH